MPRVKRITLYAQPQDLRNLARIKATKPHWPTSFIMREALAMLAATFPKLPPQTDLPVGQTGAYPPIQDNTRLVKD